MWGRIPDLTRLMLATTPACTTGAPSPRWAYDRLIVSSVFGDVPIDPCQFCWEHDVLLVV